MRRCWSTLWGCREVQFLVFGSGLDGTKRNEFLWWMEEGVWIHLSLPDISVKVFPEMNRGNLMV